MLYKNPFIIVAAAAVLTLAITMPSMCAKPTASKNPKGTANTQVHRDKAMTKLALSVVGADITVNKKVDKWLVYQGAWFKISYPPGFTVRPSLKSLTSSKGYDSAFFEPRDKSVQFYVFSPQWNGKPKDIAVNPITENVASTKTVEKRVGQVENITIKWTTIAAKNGSYLRSIVDTVSSLNTRTAFAIKYRNSKTLEKYKPDYARFKKSLEQYAD